MFGNGWFDCQPEFFADIGKGWFERNGFWLEKRKKQDRAFSSGTQHFKDEFSSILRLDVFERINADNRVKRTVFESELHTGQNFGIETPVLVQRNRFVHANIRFVGKIIRTIAVTAHVKNGFADRPLGNDPIAMIRIRIQRTF